MGMARSGFAGGAASSDLFFEWESSCLRDDSRWRLDRISVSPEAMEAVNIVIWSLDTSQ